MDNGEKDLNCSKADNCCLILGSSLSSPLDIQQIVDDNEEKKIYQINQATKMDEQNTKFESSVITFENALIFQFNVLDFCT